MYTVYASETPVPATLPVNLGVNEFSGFPDEWNALDNYNFYESSGGLTELRAAQRGDRLFLSVKGSGMLADSIFYLDSDNDPISGASIASWGNSTGIDFKIANDKLYKYVSGAWQLVTAIEFSKSDTFIEAAVDIDDLGLHESRRMKVGFAKLTYEALPESGEPMLDVAAAPAESYGPDANITVDGLSSDWTGIQPIAASSDSVTQMYAVMNNGTLYAMVKGKLGDFNDIFIDTDNDPATGYAYSGWPTFGGDYLIENGRLYRSTGSGWNWDAFSSGSVTYTKTDYGNQQFVELSIPISSLGLVEPRTIRLAFKAGDTLIPQRKGEPGIVNPSLPNVSVDGNGADWTGLPRTATGEGVIENVYSFIKDDTLNVLAYGTNLSSGSRLFIDSDNRPDTGYQGPRYARTGADYLVENGIVYASMGPGWSWNPVGSAQSVVTSVYTGPGKQNLEMSVNTSGWSGISGRVNIALGVGNDYAPAAGSASYVPVTSRHGAMIAIDGLDDDWKAIDNAAYVTSSKMKIRAVQDRHKLYMLVEGKDLNTQNAI